MQLRLLLQPLATHIFNVRQFIECFSPQSKGRSTSKIVTKSRVHGRVEEVQSLLLQWYAIARSSMKDRLAQSGVNDAPMAINLVIYHLLSLNTILSFPTIEHLICNGPAWNSSKQFANMIEEPEEVWLHSGQVLRLIRMIPLQLRPPWWAASIYRAAIIAWATSFSHSVHSSNQSSTTSSQWSLSPANDNGSYLTPANGTGSGLGLGADSNNNNSNNTADGGMVAFDALAPDDNRMEKYLKQNDGTPVLTRRTGELVLLDNPKDVLDVFIEALDSADGLCFTRGIRDKMKLMAERWLVAMNAMNNVE